MTMTLRLTILLLLGLALPAAGQFPGTASTPPAAAETTVDPLGRDTPAGTIRGFNRAVGRDDLVSAAMYLQLTSAQRADASELARQLNELIDRYFLQPLTTLSSSRSGAVNDGLTLDRERIQLTIDGKPHDLLLVRVTDPQAGQIWLISSGSVAEVPKLYASAQAPWLERIMPELLVNWTMFGISAARVLAYLVTVAVPFVGLWLLSILVIVLGRMLVTDPKRRRLLESWYARLRWLTVIVLAVLLHVTLIRYLAFSLSFRYVYARIAMVAVVIAGAWLLIRFITLSGIQARAAAQRRGETGFSSLLMLAERVGKVIVTLVALFVILTLAGVDTTTALAGVGIGGVAVALGAQKTVENLLGGVFLISDNALAVGDQCRIADRIGWIEDITLRSVRMRTLDQTLLSLPAGTLAQASIENFSTRSKILIQTILRLRYETSSAQLQAVLAGIRKLLDSNPDLEPGSARIRLVDFSAQAMELELFAYVATPDALKFLAVQEELLLRVSEVVESAGTAFARPTQFVYLQESAETARPVPEGAHS